jgi:ATP-dependent DNA helicase PIF1
MECKTFLESGKALSLSQIDSSLKLSHTEIEYEMQSLVSNSNTQETLSLKKGAIVMCTVNLDMDQGICNGSQGIIIGFTEGAGFPVVKFVNGITKTINMHYRQSDDYPPLAVGQIPLCLAWALTIHKSQGATLDAAEIDAGSGIFECGQTYVALSRVKSLDGLYLTSFEFD